VRLYRLAAEILAAVEAGVFPPRDGWPCQDCPVRSQCWVWVRRGRVTREVDAPSRFTVCRLVEVGRTG
jgi:hypothetical protein